MKSQNEQNVISDEAVERLKTELTNMTDEQELRSIQAVVQEAQNMLQLVATRCHDKGWTFKTVEGGVHGPSDQAHIGAYVTDAWQMTHTALLKIAGDLAAIEKAQYGEAK